MENKYLIIIAVILVAAIAAGAYGYYTYTSNQNNLNVSIPLGYHLTNQNETDVNFTNGEVNIRYNVLTDFNQTFDDQVKEFYDKYGDNRTIKNSTKTYPNNITVVSVQSDNSTDVHNHYWFKINDTNYHIYTHGNDQNAVDSIIESI